MKPDWSKAPEGATHHCSGRNAWFKQDENDMWLAWQAYGRMHGQPLIGWCFCHAPDGSDVSTKTWTGEGLPPVGTVCEAMLPSAGHQWVEVLVVWHHPELEGSAAVVHGGGRLVGWSSAFRPIRTPEQIAADEREAKAKAMWQQIYFNTDPDHWYNAPDGTRDTFRAAIDAGWQKVAP